VADLRSILESAAATQSQDSASSAGLVRGSYRTRNVRLRPLLERDLPALYVSALDPTQAHRWRFRGATPSPDHFRQTVFDPNVLAQYAVVEIDSDTLAGIVTAYGADLASGHCYGAMLRVASAASGVRPGAVTEGFGIFLGYLFDHFDLRKIYLEVPEYNLSIVEGLDGLLGGVPSAV
jgi:RimJ/RimL family protein N-acetyltransferase